MFSAGYGVRLPNRPRIVDFDPERLKLECEKLGMDKYRALQVLDWIYRKGVYEFGRMTNLPLEMRKSMSSHFSVGIAGIRSRRSSRDGSVKLLIELGEGEFVETVLIVRQKRRTVCVSTQVGCKFHCAFCASGQGGFSRNLSAGEIVSQVLAARDASENQRLTHIVFMGMGEPLDNYNQVMQAVRLLNDGSLLGIGARRMTLSTCGIVPKIGQLAEEGLQIELSVSLNGAREDLRTALMPVNRRYPLATLLPACAEYTRKTKREITFEYLLADGLNASRRHAEELASLLKKTPCKVNLIPLNPIAGFSYEQPTVTQIQAFVRVLQKKGIRTTVRKSSGQDIEAACGQLRCREMQEQRVKGGV